MFDYTLAIPQWQGSAADDAHRLAEGAHTVTALLAAETQAVAPVPEGHTGGDHEPVRHLDVLIRSAEAVRAALPQGRHGVVVAGGDCGIELVPITRAVERYGSDLAVVWFDAHADLNTPETSPSGAFHGMVLRTLLGEGPAPLLPTHEQRVRPSQVVLAGTRSFDPAEEEFIARAEIPIVAVPDLYTPERLLSAVADTGASCVYIHLDLDVLDSRHCRGLSCPEPAGLHPAHLRNALEALTRHFRSAGVGITEYAPQSLDNDAEQKTLRTILGAVPVTQSAPTAGNTDAARISDTTNCDCGRRDRPANTADQYGR